MAEPDWVAFFRELGQKLLPFETNSGELVAKLQAMKESGIPVFLLEDRGAGDRRFLLTEIDPFTFLGAANRNVKLESRLRVLEWLKDDLSMTAPVPTALEVGIPTLNNLKVWYFPFQKDRDPDDIPALWRLFRQAVADGRAGVEAGLFERCLDIRSVGPAKLTMGLFWVRPGEFLPLDSNTLAYLKIKKAPRRYADYLTLLEETTARYGKPFWQISHDAWNDVKERPLFWAGGILWNGTENKLPEFRAGNYWKLGWSKDSENPSAIRARQLFERIRVGDRFAMKGIGGRNDLQIHYVGEVTGIQDDDLRLDLEPLDRPHFHGKAPTGSGAGNWRESLLEVKRPEDRELLFGSAPPPPPPPPSPVSPRNLLLFGPPGTGKTYRLRAEFQPMYESERTDSPKEQLLDRYRDLPWYLAAALALDALGGEASVPALRDQRYVKRKAQAQNRDPSKCLQTLWRILMSHTVPESTTVKAKGQYGEAIFDKRENSNWYFPDGPPDHLAELKAELDELERDSDAARVSRNWRFLTFHQSFAYEEFIEGIRPGLSDTDEGDLSYSLVDGIFKHACAAAVRLTGFDGSLDSFCALPPVERRRLLADAPRYAVFIDEINRGNVSRTFGELITLLEPDKRLGEENELIAELPYSRTRFGVPSNLDVYGTMNTADRSIEALDTALRRRFQFEACEPDIGLLPEEPVDGVDLRALLKTINDRVERIYDRDHRIGHSYLMEVSTLDDLRGAFAHCILPLLQEYFYGDWGKIGLVLGPRFVRSKGADSTKLATFDAEAAAEFVDVTEYRLARVDELAAEDFQTIYATSTDDPAV